MKNLTVIFFSIAVFLNLFTGFGTGARANSRNIAVENQSFSQSALKGEITIDPIKAFLSSPKSPRRDFSSGLGKKPKYDVALQNASPFAVFLKSDIEAFVPIYPRKAVALSAKTEFSSTSFLF